jgi:predicted transcriptional regulator
MFLARRESSELEEKKRTKFQIYLDILEALSEELCSKPNLQLSKIAHKTNLPYDRFRGDFKRLMQLGLINLNQGSRFAITEKGREYVREIKRFNEFLRNRGINQ